VFQVPGRRADSLLIGRYTNFRDTTVSAEKLMDLPIDFALDIRKFRLLVTLKTVQILVNYRCRISPFTMTRVMQRLRRTMGYLLEGGMTAFPVDD